METKAKAKANADAQARAAQLATAVNPKPLPIGDCPEYVGSFLDRHDWNWNDPTVNVPPVSVRITIDGQEVRRVLWCNTKTGLAEIAVTGTADKVLLAAGRRDIATIIVQGKIVVEVLSEPRST